MDKKQIRTQMKKTLQDFAKNTAQKEAKEQRLLEKLQNTKTFQHAQTIGLTYPLDFEPDTRKIMTLCQTYGKKVYLPKIYPNRQMIFSAYTENTRLKPSSFGIMEIVDAQPVKKDTLDLLLVPALAVNQDGYRIGFGGGYFDAFLSDFPGKTMGLYFDFQLIAFDAEPFDQPINTFFLA